jgi:hypothetical protein
MLKCIITFYEESQKAVADSPPEKKVTWAYIKTTLSHVVGSSRTPSSWYVRTRAVRTLIGYQPPMTVVFHANKIIVICGLEAAGYLILCVLFTFYDDSEYYRIVLSHFVSHSLTSIPLPFVPVRPFPFPSLLSLFSPNLSSDTPIHLSDYATICLPVCSSGP